MKRKPRPFKFARACRLMTEAEADAMAKRRWGPRGGARRSDTGYGVGSGTFNARFGVSDKSFEDAFRDADERDRTMG
jgi:hypothetical protein